MIVDHSTTLAALFKGFHRFVLEPEGKTDYLEALARPLS